MKSRLARILLATVVVAPALAVPAAAQSVFATRGLGYSLDPQDARSLALGGAAIGSPDPEISWIDLAGALGLPAPGMVLAYQYDNFTADGAERSFAGSSARFPLLLGAFPAGERLVITAGFGAFLDQNWQVEEPDTLIIAGDSVPILDRFSSEGGVTRIRLGGAYRVAGDFGIGAGVDFHTGSGERVHGRLFPGEPEPACCRAAWTYRGLGYSLGLRWTPGEATGVGVSASYGGALRASPADTLALERSYALPLLLRAGASGRVGATTLLAISGNFSGWSVLDEQLAAEGGAHDSWSVQGGVEWDGLVVRERPLPVRVGARTGTLPFGWIPGQAGEQATERALAVGAGIVLGGGASRSDFALEFGGRGGEAAGVDESYWRFAFSVRIIGQ
jgi:hypothetical protein